MSTHPVTPRVGIHAVLSVLADAADSGSPPRRPSNRLPERLEWLPLSQVGQMPNWGPGGVPVRTDGQALQGLAGVDAIRPGEDVLRIGWLWVAGRTDPNVASSRVFEPLITTRARIPGNTVITDGELVLTDLVTDPSARRQLETGLGPGAAAFGPADRMQAFAAHLAGAAGFDATHLAPVDGPPSRMSRNPTLRIVTGLGIYATTVTYDFSAVGSLRQWHERVGTTTTALHALYLDRPVQPAPPEPELPSAFPLTQTQWACLTEARTAPVTVISGAPGTGKTHTIAAIVGDHVVRGKSVLIAAKSEATVDAITEMLDARPGPDPVVFGSSRRRIALARTLAAGGIRTTPKHEVQQAWESLAAAQQERDHRWEEAATMLRGYQLLGSGRGAPAIYSRLPGLARPDVDLLELTSLVREVGDQPPPWHRLGRRRRWRGLCTLLGVADPQPAAIADALALACAVRNGHVTPDPLFVGPDWAGLAAAQRAVEDAAGHWMDAVASDERRLTRQTRGVQGALATALRSARHVRRTRLAELGAEVTSALPVWVGTLGDIDDLLPMRPALFDLVVLDEASSIDQPRAATALLRGRRTVVVGDPRQLRHVSFISDEAAGDALARHAPGADAGLCGKLDIRRNSIFDVAAATSPVRQLDEHFRSGAHLFSFVGRRLYDDQVRVATVTPADDGADLVHVDHGTAARNASKVVAAEVGAVLVRLRTMMEEGATSVGVISPFRAQADAIEEAALQAFSAAQIEQLGLRVGTVHAFQGMERQTVLVSLGIGTEDGPMTWRFAADPHLFAVMATRARLRLEWLVSATPPDGSLLAEYLDEQDNPPQPRRTVTTDDHWTATLAGLVEGAPVDVCAPYPVGRHDVDLCVVGEEGYLGVVTRVHARGPQAHLRRQLDLMNAGWPLVTAFESAWHDRQGELAVRLRQGRFASS